MCVRCCRPLIFTMDARHQTVAEIIRSVVAEYIRSEANTEPLITVTRVEVGPNFRRATVLFTTIPDERESDALTFLKRHAREMRGAIKNNTKLKYLPYLEFAIDRGERHRQHIDTLVNEHKITPPEKGAEPKNNTSTNT